MVDRDFDCLIVDCEDCLVGEHRKNPDLFKDIKRIQVERDDSGAWRRPGDAASSGHYDPLFQQLGLKLIHTGKGCEGRCVTEVWDRI
jgi:hypothetical protein